MSDEQPQGGQMNAQQMMQMMQQRLGNMELTLHALLAVLDDNDVVDEDTINEKAQEIVEEMEDQQGAPAPDHDHE